MSPGGGQAEGFETPASGLTDVREVEDDLGEAASHLSDLLDSLEIASVDLKEDGYAELPDLVDNLLGVRVLDVAGLLRVERGRQHLMGGRDDRVGRQEGEGEGEVG